MQVHPILKILRRLNIVAGLIFITVMSAHASNELQDILDMNLNQLMDQEVITASKTLQRISEAPGTIIVITNDEIKERGYFNLVDLLEDLPSIDIQRQSTPNQFNRIAIRGNAGNNKFLILQNGLRIGGPTGESIPVDDNFPVFHAQRVEVIYGPVSALYGADAFTGIINIITKDANSIDGVEISSALGTDDFFYNYLNVGKAINEKFSFTFGGHWQTSENADLSEAYPNLYQGFQGDLLDADGNIFRTAATRGDRFFGETGSHSVYVELNAFKKFNVGFTRSFLSHPTTVNANPERTLFTENSKLKTLIQSIHGNYTFEVNSQLSGRTSINYSYYELLPSSKFTNDVGGFNAFKYAEGERLKFEQQVNFDINKNHRLVGGLLFINFDALPRTADLPREFDPDLAPNAQGLLYPNTTIPILFFDVDYQNYGVYLQAQSKWNNWFATTLGTRFDYDSRYGSTVNPRLGAIFTISQKTVFEILYSESFLAPSPERAFTHFGSFDGFINGSGQFQTFFFFIPNPNLEPEKSRNLELNLTHKVTPDFVASLTGYFTFVEDMIETVRLPNPSTFIPGALILRPRRLENIGEATIYGMDLRLDYRREVGNWVMKFWANYSWVNGNIDLGDGTTSPLPQIARNKVKLGATFTYNNQFYITPRLFWIDGITLFPTNLNQKTDSYTVVHLHAGIKNIYKNLSAFIDIRNIFDVDYFNSGNLNNRDFDQSPQAPRRIVFGLRLQI